jgi:hypothetical protein
LSIGRMPARSRTATRQTERTRSSSAFSIVGVRDVGVRDAGGNWGLLRKALALESAVPRRDGTAVIAFRTRRMGLGRDNGVSKLFRRQLKCSITTPIPTVIPRYL